MNLKDRDKQMIAGLKAGEEGYFNQLFNEYYLLLSQFACRYVKDMDLAREIVQDLFVHLFEIRNSLVITTSFKSYLYQSVRNRCLNQISQNQLHENHLENLKTEENFTANIEEGIMETELEYRIYEIVSRLPAQCQKIFKMSRIEGKKNAEIAGILDISIRTVETQISKALKSLRHKLQDYFK